MLSVTGACLLYPAVVCDTLPWRVVYVCCFGPESWMNREASSPTSDQRYANHAAVFYVFVQTEVSLNVITCYLLFTCLQVSQNKRRYVDEDFNLDLTYVTDRVIAMSFPASGSRSLYRNSIQEVGRFLDKMHFGHYRVYNLCCEYQLLLINIEFIHS